MEQEISITDLEKMNTAELLGRFKVLCEHRAVMNYLGKLDLELDYRIEMMKKILLIRISEIESRN